MTFPDGSVKEGRFENNVFIAPPSTNSSSNDVNANSQNISPIPTTKKLPG